MEFLKRKRQLCEVKIANTLRNIGACAASSAQASLDPLPHKLRQVTGLSALCKVDVGRNVSPIVMMNPKEGGQNVSSKTTVDFTALQPATFNSKLCERI
jgi:hypothetical protein